MVRGLRIRHDARTGVRVTSAVAAKSVMSRITGALFFVGGALGAAVTALGGGAGSRTVVFGIALAGVALGILIYLVGEWMSTYAYPVFEAVATILITIAIRGHPSVVTTITLGSLYVLVACHAAFFFRTGIAICEIVFAVMCCMPALGTRPELAWWVGVVPAGVSLTVGVVVIILTRMVADADVDVLTGLLNRRGFDRLLLAEVAKAGRLDRPLALVLLDLDRFQRINEDLGQRAGNAVLRQVADTWRDLLGPKWWPARLGGDQFAVVLSDTSEPAAVALADRMRAAITTGCSAGVTSWHPGESASLVSGRTEVALYRAKRAGRNRTVLESGQLTPLAGALYQAIMDEQFDVYYQPIVSLSWGGTVVGVEALLRWSPPTEPDLDPDRVVEAAEEYDLIADLDRAVLRRACLDARRLQDSAFQGNLTLNVNVSGQELIDAGYADQVLSLLGSTGWSAEQLVLEITETQLEANSRKAIDNLNSLRGSGVRIAIDDFGTGYSSLSRLVTIPWDILKVDRHFVAAISANRTAPPLLGVIKALSAAFGVEVIAEGVETEHQASVLTELGFGWAQGYLYSRARAVEELLDELDQQHAAAVGGGTSAALSWVLPESARHLR